jgi:hypothetical protein
MKGWKTILFNALSGLLLVIGGQGVDLWGLSPELIGTITVVGNFILRFITTTAIGKKV